MSDDHKDIMESFIISSDHWVYGFTQIDNGIIDSADLNMYDKMVYIAIKRMINQKHQTTFPSYLKIGEKAGCSRRKAIDTVKRLIDFDLIAKMGKHTKFDSNVYMVKRIQESKILADPEKNQTFIQNEMGIEPVKKIEKKPDKKTDPIPFKKIMDYLNGQAGTNFSHTGQANQKLIKARWNEMAKLKMDAETIVDQFEHVINVKVAEWKSDDFMSKYLRPSTLFGNKFDQYRNETIGQTGQPSTPGNAKQQKTQSELEKLKKKYDQQGDDDQ